MDHRALLIAYHFPPIQGSSGVLRTLSLVRSLPEFGWEPLVLTAHPRAYPNTVDTMPIEIPDETIVHRAFALDTARHLSIGGKYPGFLAAPDRWWSWYLGALPSGLRMIRKYRPRVIWSTAPLATAHLIGLTLARASGLPWIADIRDLLTEPGDPALPAAWRATHWIERRTLRSANRVVVVSPGQHQEYSKRFPDIPDERFEVIPNGYDETAFKAIEEGPLNTPPISGHPQAPLTLLHSGVLYPDGRNPLPLFRAIAELIQEGALGSGEIRVVLRACGHEEQYSEMVRQLGLEDTIFFRPALPYKDALKEMLEVDGLIVLQGQSCNTAIPAKIYEYMRARRPILGLVHPDGFTCQVLESTGYLDLAETESSDRIRPVLQQFIERIRSGRAFIPSYEDVQSFSRRRSAERVAQLMNSITQSTGH